MNNLILVGIGYRPLGPQEREAVLQAETLLASTRLRDVFTRYAEYESVKGRITVIDKVPDTIAFIRERLSASPLTPHASRQSIVLLASGDPFFFGIGRRMIEEFGAERVSVLPDLSSMQEAFARVNVPWDDAFFLSLHGGPDVAKRRKLPYEVKDIPWLLERHGKLGILTDKVNNPVVVAQVLKSGIQNPQSAITMHVCGRLGYPEEKVISGSPEEIVAGSFADPNVVIIQKKEPEARSQKPEDRNDKAEFLFGLQEAEISHSRGLITKDEVRAVALHKLRLPQTGVLWDIGAGSGSVSIEAARLCPGLRVFAVERDEEQIGHIRRNRVTLRAPNVAIIPGGAPGALVELPAPDRVFIGGSGGKIGDIIELAAGRMRSGIVVVNAVTLDTLNQASASLDAAGFDVSISEVSVSRSKNIAGKRQMTALNPVFIITGEKA